MAFVERGCSILVLRRECLCDSLQSRITFDTGAAFEKVAVALAELRLLLVAVALALQRFQLRKPLFDGVLCRLLYGIISFSLLRVAAHQVTGGSLAPCDGVPIACGSEASRRL